MKVVGIIPSRYGSTRLPGKPLLDILNKSLIQRVYEQCLKSEKLDDIIVATDDDRIYNHVLEFKGKAMMTSKKHQTGTERCNEVAQKLNTEFDIIINIQGDEPFISPLQINKLIKLFNNPKTQIGTLAKKIEKLEVIKDKNTPKAIFDKEGYAISFCRNITEILPNETYYQHVGIYGYRKDILKRICRLSQSKNELEESLEQLRWLDNDYKIKVGITKLQTLSVDTTEDIEKIKATNNIK